LKNGNNSKLRFDTEKNVRSSRLKRFAAAFSCFFVLLAGVSVLLLLRHYDFNLSAIIKPADEQTTAEETTAMYTPQVEGVRSYLLVCMDDNRSAIRFTTVVTADMDKNKLIITGLDTAESVSAAGFTGNFEQHLNYGGIDQMVLAAEEMSDIKIDRYVTSTDTRFRSAVNYVGGFEIDVKKAIDVRTPDLTAIISEGKQTMSGDTMLSYIRYFEGQPQIQAELIAEMVGQKITEENFAKADRYYERIINLIESNISVLDFSSMKLSFQALISGKEKAKIIVTD
jgi:hypothetical protein